MAKKKQPEIRGDQRLENIEESLTKTELFIVNNQKTISIVIGVIVVAILGYFGFQRYYQQPKTKEAQEQMFMAQRFFESDSLDKALYGDGNSLGFIDISDEYGFTKPGNLANYYAGISFLKKGEFNQAIEFLEDFNSDDHIVGPMAIGAMGDAYLELGDREKAVTHYLEAADKVDNDFTSPMFLFKAGQVYEIMGDYDAAVDAYTRIKDDYARSNEGRVVEKNIARAETKGERN